MKVTTCWDKCAQNINDTINKYISRIVTRLEQADTHFNEDTGVN